MHPKLIADSGSTKTDWRFLGEDGRIIPLATVGLNPYFVTSLEIAEIVSEVLSVMSPSLAVSDLLQIHFYGAGCGTAENSDTVRKGLGRVFPGAEIFVNTDILGAAHALCGRESGMVGILGTGMNSCCFDGNKILMQQPSLGFILGDEGSGAYLGKKLIQDYLNKELPEHLELLLENRFQLSLETILRSVYKEKDPNRFLASFSKFIYQNLKEDYCVNLVADAFRAFLDKQIRKYPSWSGHNLSCTGSVAFWFSNILRRICEEKGVRLDRVIESPIAALALYHLEEEISGE
jgi:glucosamine kinase